MKFQREEKEPVEEMKDVEEGNEDEEDNGDLNALGDRVSNLFGFQEDEEETGKDMPTCGFIPSD